MGIKFTPGTIDLGPPITEYPVPKEGLKAGQEHVADVYSAIIAQDLSTEERERGPVLIGHVYKIAGSDTLEIRLGAAPASGRALIRFKPGRVALD